MGRVTKVKVSRLTSEFIPVEQDHDFATFIGTPDREETSKLSDISDENSAGDEVVTQKETEDNEETEDFESPISLKSSALENEASTNIKNGRFDQFGAFRTINKTIDG